jgi:hypothetical protein
MHRAIMKGIALNIDQITIETPNPKCRLYGCLVEFIDGDTASHVGIFDPYKIALPPQTKTSEGRGPQINTCRQVHLQSIFKKSQHLG